ncbi:MAG: DUF975 family protein [Treponemataceae bacterium]|nr:DUF975 family protein [Treponemataceae bacterium]
MFERKKFKAAALEQLKGRWKIPVLATLLTYVLIGIFTAAVFALFGLNFLATDNDYSLSALGNSGIFVSYSPSRISEFFDIILSGVVFVFFVAILNVHNTMLKENRKIYFSDFTNGLNQWWQAFRGGLWFILWVFAWSLLFLIPGIVKFYSYSMMFFIMAENPEIGVCKAMEISKELTRGYKGELFVLDLSFIGWSILASIPCGLGLLWLMPYMNMTKTNVYQYLKQAALDTNRVSLADFE